MDDRLSGSAERIVRNDPRYPLFLERFPEWTLLFRRLPNHGEIVNWRRKILVVDADAPDPIWSTAHIVAHAHLHYRVHVRDRCPQPITPVEELDANWMADMWLAWTAERLSA